MAVRLQLRLALADLQHPDLARQAEFAVERLLEDAGDAPTIDWFIQETLRVPQHLPPSTRRTRIRLAALALRSHVPPDWGLALLHLRDRLVERVAAEDSPSAALELQALTRQLTAAIVEAYCRSQFHSLGFRSKAEVPRDWLSWLLITPLLRAACKGPARTCVANACLLVHVVLLECGRWAKSASVMHAAVDCLKQMLKLAGSGALSMSSSELFLPLQSCLPLLGPRLKAAALDSILQLCTRGMQRSEWQVRKAATDTLAVLASTLLPGNTPLAAAAIVAGGASGGMARIAGSGAMLQQQQLQLQQQPLQQQQQVQQQGCAALESLAPAIVAAVTQHVKYDRIPAVRQAAAAVLLLLYRLPAFQQEQRPPASQLPFTKGGISRRSPAVQKSSSTRPIVEPSSSAKPGPNEAAAAAAVASVGDAVVPTQAALLPAASHKPAGASLKRLSASWKSLQAVIAERRQMQLQTAAAAEAVDRSPAGNARMTVACAPTIEADDAGGADVVVTVVVAAAAKAAAEAEPVVASGKGAASSVGSADGDWPAARDRIRAWAGAAAEQEQHDEQGMQQQGQHQQPPAIQDEQQIQEQESEEQDVDGLPPATAPLWASPRPHHHSTEVYQAAAEVMERLHPQQAARKRRAWGSQPASPEKHATINGSISLGGFNGIDSGDSGTGAPASVPVPAFQEAAALDESLLQDFLRQASAVAAMPAPGSRQAAGRDRQQQQPQQPQQQQQQQQPQSQQSQQQHVWRQNPLAHLADEEGEPALGRSYPLADPARIGAGRGAVAAAEAAAGVEARVEVVPCVHHIEYPQFSLRLQASPAEVQLGLTADDTADGTADGIAGSTTKEPGASATATQLQSVRFWAGQASSDVGVEFQLTQGGPVRRYWLHQGQLHQQHTVAAASKTHGSRAPGGGIFSAAAHHASAAGDRHIDTTAAQPAPKLPSSAAQSSLPLVSPAAQQQPLHTPAPSLPVPGLGAACHPAGTANAALPHFQPDADQPPEQSQLREESPLASLATAALPSFSPDKPAAVGQLQDSFSPEEPAAGRLQDRFSPDRKPEAVRAATHAAWGDSPALPDAQADVSSAVSGDNAACVTQHKLQEKAQQQPEKDQQQQRQQQHQEQQHEEKAGSSRRAQGPLTAMVTRAVSKLQQLEELQQELHLPPGGPALHAGPAGPAGLSWPVIAATAGTSGISLAAGSSLLSGNGGGSSFPHPPRHSSQAEQAFNPRRSLDHALSAISEAPSSPAEESVGRGGNRSATATPPSYLPYTNAHSMVPASDKSRQVDYGSCFRSGGSSSKRQRWGGEAREGGEADRLRLLREQLRHSMLEIQKQVELSSGAAGGQQQQQEVQEQQAEGSLGLEGATDRKALGGGLLIKPGSSPAGSSSSTRSGKGSDGAHVDAEAQLSEREEQQSEEEQQEEEEEVAEGISPPCGSRLLLAVSNPLFGSSRPSSAATQSMPGMLPRKQRLGGSGGRQQQRQAQRWQEPPECEVQRAQREAQRAQHEVQREQQSPQLSGAATVQSLGSLGSGFGVLRHDLEAEVQQFLRGSMAIPHEQRQQQQQAHPQQQQQQQQQQLLTSQQVLPQQQQMDKRLPGCVPLQAPSAAGTATGTASGRVAAAASGRVAGAGEIGHFQLTASSPFATQLMVESSNPVVTAATSPALQPRPSSRRRPRSPSPSVAPSTDGASKVSAAASPCRSIAAASNAGWERNGGVALVVLPSQAPAKDSTDNLAEDSAEVSAEDSAADDAAGELARNQQQEGSSSCAQPGAAVSERTGTCSVRGSLDLQAILDSRPASPAKQKLVGSGGRGQVESEEGDSWGQVESEEGDSWGGAQGWQTARSSERQQGRQLTGSGEGIEGWQTARSGLRGRSGGVAWLSNSGGSGSEVAGRNSGDDSNGSSRSRSRGKGGSPDQVLQDDLLPAIAPPPEQQQADIEVQQPPLSERAGQQSPPAPLLLLHPRPASPQLPSLGISRRHARLLQGALARLGGKPEAAAQGATLQAVLTWLLQRQTAHVQAHFQQAAAQEVAAAKKAAGAVHGLDAGQAQQQQAESGAAGLRQDLQAACEAAVREELLSAVCDTNRCCHGWPRY